MRQPNAGAPFLSMIFDNAPLDPPPDTHATERGTERAALLLACIGAVLLLAVGLVWGWLQLNRLLFTENKDYNIQVVEVQNYAGLVSRDEVLRRLELTPKDLAKGVNLHAMDLSLQRQAFLVDHPGIQDFTIERYPPNRLVIALQERTPVARLGHRVNVLDEQGFIFTLPPNREYLLETLPKLIGEGFANLKPGDQIPEHERTAIDVLRGKRRHNPQLDFTILEIDLTSEVFLDLITDESVTIRLPYRTLTTEASIGRDLRLAASFLASTPIPPGGSIEIQPGERGQESKIIRN